MSESIAEHLAMVFHRFLAGETIARGGRLRDLSQRRTARAVGSVRPQRAGDPAARRAAAPHRARRLDARRLAFARTCFRARCSSRRPEAHALPPGPRKWNRQQGFYIYRGDRMIQSGGWNRLRTMDEHSKLARIAVDVPADLEELFQINVAKMRVSLPEEICARSSGSRRRRRRRRPGRLPAPTPART